MPLKRGEKPVGLPKKAHSNHPILGVISQDYRMMRQMVAQDTSAAPTRC